MRLLFWLVVAACTPSPPDGVIRCAPPPEKACPDGYGCAADGTCWQHPDDYIADAFIPCGDACN
jgi:hypothetical protein